MARLEETKRPGEGGLANNVERKIVNPFVKMDATGGREPAELAELVSKEGKTAVDMLFAF